MDVYVVVDGSRVVGVSARLQGAEVIRSNWAFNVADNLIRQQRGLGVHIMPDRDTEAWKVANKAIYDGMRIENHELRDMED